MHTPLKQCTSDCRRYGCPEEDLCVHCGANKWQDTDKHIGEVLAFCKAKIEECQKIMGDIIDELKHE